jgi:hypothetical protein
MGLLSGLAKAGGKNVRLPAGASAWASKAGNALFVKNKAGKTTIWRRTAKVKRLLVVVVSALAALVLAGAFATAAPGASNPVANSATGSGHRISGGELRSFSFSAVRYADGTAGGQAQVYPRSLGGFAHIVIDCLEVTGNVAHMSGHVTHTSDPTLFLPNEHVHFAVEDNGQGNSAQPDRVTGIPANEPLRCDDGQLPSSNFSEIVRGNVQVR